jgi:hypothetical protein
MSSGAFLNAQVEQRSVPESLDRKYDSQPATGHTFFCLNMLFLINSRDSESVFLSSIIKKTMFLVECFACTIRH